MNKDTKLNTLYAAGILANDNWVWQGLVLASNAKEAKSLLIMFKKQEYKNANRYATSISEKLIKMMNDGEKFQSEKDKGVYDSVNLAELGLPVFTA